MTPSPAAGDGVAEERLLLGRVRAGAEVDVVGAERDPGELARTRRRPRRSARPPASTPTPPAARAAARPARGDVQGLGPGGDPQLAGLLVADHGVLEPVGGGLPGEGPAALVAVPVLVDRRVLAAPGGASRCRAGGRPAARSRRRSARRRPASRPGRTAGPGTGRRRRSARRPGRSARCCRRSSSRTAGRSRRRSPPPSVTDGRS